MKRQPRLTPIFGILILLATIVGNAGEGQRGPRDAGDRRGSREPPEKKEGKGPNFYPLQVGNAWHFKVTVGANSASAISRIAHMEQIGDGPPLARLEASIHDKVVATEHLLQNSKGIFRYRNNNQAITPPLCLLKYPVLAGSQWEGDMTVGNDKGKYTCETKEEAVEVPAGKFKTIRVAIRLEDDKGQVINTVYWFAADIGFVKQTVDAPNLKVLMELEKAVRAK